MLKKMVALSLAVGISLAATPIISLADDDSQLNAITDNGVADNAAISGNDTIMLNENTDSSSDTDSINATE